MLQFRLQRLVTSTMTRLKPLIPSNSIPPRDSAQDGRGRSHIQEYEYFITGEKMGVEQDVFLGVSYLAGHQVQGQRRQGQSAGSPR